MKDSSTRTAAQDGRSSSPISDHWADDGGSSFSSSEPVKPARPSSVATAHVTSISSHKNKPAVGVKSAATANIDNRTEIQLRQLLLRQIRDDADNKPAVGVKSAATANIDKRTETQLRQLLLRQIRDDGGSSSSSSESVKPARPSRVTTAHATAISSHKNKPAVGVKSAATANIAKRTEIQLRQLLLRQIDTRKPETDTSQTRVLRTSTTHNQQQHQNPQEQQQRKQSLHMREQQLRNQLHKSLRRRTGQNSAKAGQQMWEGSAPSHLQPGGAKRKRRRGRGKLPG